MEKPAILAWLEANRESLPIGLAVAAGIIALMLLLRWAGASMARSDPTCASWKGVIGRVLAKTSVVFIVVTAIEIVLTYAAPPPRVSHLSDILFTIAAALQAAIWGRELVLGIVSHRVADDTESTLGNATAIIRVLVNFAFFAVAIVVILDNLAVNVTALVAGLGIGGIAIGLAAQGIFSDLFAALSILFDRPFRRGDTVRYGTTTAVVERIGLKTTRLRAMTGEQVIMANTKLLENEIHNFALSTQRRQVIAFTLVHQAPIESVEALTEIARPAVEGQRGCKLVRCLATNIGPNGIDCECVYDDRSKDQDT